ncbi:TonB-dependent receptor plug domain-containing protein [Daejeonella oryzae]|uniref:TonB-dependent receptor plug domain-containing protein n=1 Tax=Daejeonella oryzae TaxID=1122943 RepID=UPI000423D9CA|nr:TonB-dependent receptor [Daejeonella oryzae]
MLFIKNYILLTWLVLFPFFLRAQNKTATDTTKLKEVVVVSSRFEESKENVAQAVQVITGARLKQLNSISTADVLQQTPGVSVQKSQLGGGSPVIRGFEANRILLVVDGVRMNNAIYRGGHLQNSITVDNNSLEKIEVGFGSSSVFYGSDALGGVVQFFTKKPVLNTTSGSALARFSTAANEYTSSINFNFGREKWAATTVVTYSKIGDLRQGANNYQPGTEKWKSIYFVEQSNGADLVRTNSRPEVQTQTGYNQMDLLQKFLYRNNDRVTQVLNFQYSNSGDIPRYDRLAQLENNQPRYAEWYYGPQKRFSGSYQLQLNNFKKLFNHSNITIAYQNLVESRHDRRLNSSNLNNRSEEVGIFSLNADFNKTFKKNDLGYGIELNQNYVQSRANRLNISTGTITNLDTRYPDGGSDVFSAAAFVSHRFKINKKWQITEGLRLNHVNLYAKFNDKRFFPFDFNSVNQANIALNGNASIIYKPKNDFKISLLGSSGFRAPNVDDLAKVFESTAGSVILPNPDLKPEYTYNAELGFEKNFKENATITLNGFYTWYRNAITTQPFLFNGQSEIFYDGELSIVTANVNAQKAYLTGFSADLTFNPLRNIIVKSNAAYTFARITSLSPQQPLDHIPPFMGLSSIEYAFKNFQGEFFVQYNQRKKLKDYNLNGEDNLPQATPNGMPAWYTVNVRAGLDLNKNFRIQTALENILDRNYRVFASGISAPGRNFIVSLRGSF